jgi:hypothetical protein
LGRPISEVSTSNNFFIENLIPLIGIRNMLESEIVSLLTSSIQTESLMSDAATQVRNAKEEKIGLSEDLFRDGYEHVTNIDISATVVKQMQDRYKEEIPSLKCKSYRLTFSPSNGCA